MTGHQTLLKIELSSGEMSFEFLGGDVVVRRNFFAGILSEKSLDHRGHQGDPFHETDHKVLGVCFLWAS